MGVQKFADFVRSDVLCVAACSSPSQQRRGEPAMTDEQHEAAAERALAHASEGVDDITPAQDRIEGARAIAAFMGLTERQVRWRIYRRLLPHAREGERIVASRRALRAHWLKTTGGVAA